MKLHNNKQLFRDALRFTAEKMGIPPEYVEKDYWVTYSLLAIFNSDIGKDVVFKGGTALSKCYNMIERFSEDIDLVVLRREGESDSRMKSKLEKISRIIEATLPEIFTEGMTRKMGMNRKTVHSYNKEFNDDYGQVLDKIVLESSWLGYHEPHTSKRIISFVGQMILDNNQPEIVKEYGLQAFDVPTLEPIRTICEKIMSLVRFSYGEIPLDDLKKKIRHAYDLHQLLKQKEFLDFFNSSSFDELLLKVANDDVVSFRNNNKWLINHPKDALIFKEIDTVWNDLKSTYLGDFKTMVYGELPDEKDVFKTLQMIRERLESISWTIKLEQ